MKLYITRHGETDWNKEHRLQGQADTHLNEFGRSLARKTAVGLKDVPFDVCIASHLDRAIETAKLILGERDIPVLQDERIAEINFGKWEGLSCDPDNWEVPDAFHDFFDDPVNYDLGEGTETFYDIKKRTGEFLNDLYNKKEYEDKTILIVTHGTALSSMMNNIKNLTVADWPAKVHKNCAVTEVLVTDGVPEILSENQVYYDDEVPDWSPSK